MASILSWEVRTTRTFLGAIVCELWIVDVDVGGCELVAL